VGNSSDVISGRIVRGGGGGEGGGYLSTKIHLNGGPECLIAI
jgi:hypothetical protein